MPASGSGERRPTIRDVASAAGVSKSLVSLVYASPGSVSRARRERVLQAAAALGFRPNQAARSLAAVHGGFVGVLIADLHNPVFAVLVDAVRSELARAGTTALVTATTPGGSGPGGDVDLFGDLRPAGLLVVGSVPDLPRVADLAAGRPVVLVSTISTELPLARTVRGDDARGVGLLVDHLVTLGHVRIGHVGGSGGPVAELRESAFREAMAGAGLGGAARVARSDFSVGGGRAAAERLLAADPDLSAIVAVNDLAAVGALEAVQAADRRVAVTGYDATYLAGLAQISLTTVDPGNERIGTVAAALLLDPQGPDEVLVEPVLVPRASTFHV